MIEIKYTGENKSVIVVGSNSGIGQALINELLIAKVKVFGLDIQEESSIENNLFQYFCCDPKSEESIIAVKQNLESISNKIDGLVNLSGSIKNFKTLAELSKEEWLETYDISFQSCFNSCKFFQDLLLASPKASIVNMSSGLAFIGQKNYGPYSAAKAAINSLSKTLAVELAPSIRVNTIAPGAVKTAFLDKEGGGTRIDEAAYNKMVPLGSMAMPEEIASVIIFLLSDGASHITGECIHVNGGVM